MEPGRGLLVRFLLVSWSNKNDLRQHRSFGVGYASGGFINF